MSDTRKDKRAPVSLKVRFKSATVDEFIEQYAKDISHGGLFIKSKTPMAIGTLLKFEFQLKDESKLIQGVGRVVWKREAGDDGGEDKPAGMGIKFIKMDGESKTLVDQIVEGRGDGPGQYEAGAPAGAALTGDGDEGDAPKAATRPVRSQKATMQFFPSTTPMSELPKPEDRTQVRHASEFLASALASGGVDDLASQEADAKAEEARKRSAEIEREREAQQRAAREAEESAAREKAERERQERERVEREEREAEDKKKRDAEKAAAAKAAAADGDKPKKAEPAPEKKAAAPASVSERPAAKTPSVRPKDPSKKVTPVVEPTPAPGSGSNMVIPIAIGLIVVLGAGGYFYMNRGGTTTEVTTSGTETPPEPTEPTEPTEPVEGTEVVEGTEEVPEAPPEVPPEPVPTFEVAVSTTPPGATLTIAGAEVGTSPATLSLPEGATTISARLPGYAEGTGEVTVAEGVDPVRIALTALPFAVDVTTTPPGARVRVGSRSGTAPGRVEIPRPTAPVRVTVSLSGFADQTTTLEPSAFTESGDAMVASVALTMVARVRPTGGGTRPGGTGAATGGTEPAGGGTEPAGGGTEPAGGGTEPAGGGTEPAGGGSEPTGGSEPAGGGSEPSGGSEPEGAVPENPF